MDCFFYRDGRVCAALSVTVCPKTRGKKCSFYKTPDEYYAAQEKTAARLAAIHWVPSCMRDKEDEEEFE